MTTPETIATDATAASAISGSFKTTLTGAGTTIVGGLTANNVTALSGLLLAILGIALQWYFQRRRDRREQEERAEAHAEHLARLAQLQGGAHG